MSGCAKEKRGIHAVRKRIFQQAISAEKVAGESEGNEGVSRRGCFRLSYEIVQSIESKCGRISFKARFGDLIEWCWLIHFVLVGWRGDFSGHGRCEAGAGGFAVRV